MNNKIIIGSRGSKLSLAYANKVKNLISSFDPSIEEKIFNFSKEEGINLMKINSF